MMKNRIMLTVIIFFIFIDAGCIFLSLTMTPLSLKRECFTFEYGDEIPTDPAEYVNANDSILKSVQLNLKDVSPEVGKYHASITYLNQVYDFEIQIADTIKPRFQLKQIEFSVKVGQKVEAKNLIKDIKDKSKTKVYFYNEDTEKMTQFKSYAKEGSYIERIIVKDEHGNQSASLRVKIVASNNKVKPYFTGIQNETIIINSAFDSLEGVRAIDDIEGDISSRIVVRGKIDTKKLGQYQLTYTVKDSAGNMAIKKRKVEVVE